MPKLFPFFRKHGANLLMVAVFLFLFLYPGARPWLMQRMFDIGLFEPDLATAHTDTRQAVASFIFKQETKESTELSALNGSWVLLNFWAPWCPPCRAELPSLQQLSRKTAGKRLIILLVDMEGDKKRSAELLAQLKITLPNVYPISNPDAVLFSGTLPTTVLLDPAGKLVWKHEGLANYDDPGFLRQLNSFMAQNND